MELPKGMVVASYEKSKIKSYAGNPLIEALPPIKDIQDVREALKGEVDFNPKDQFENSAHRSHALTSLLDDFFQPLSCHIQLEAKLSIMIRRGYVGRNISDGSLNTHLQDGYERVLTGDLKSYRFHHATSTASSLSLIGCSGSGKTTTLNRILSTYPQVIFHEKHNFTQVTYLKIDCPHDGSLKNLCIQFFRGLDLAVDGNYEQKYIKKRHSIETLLAMMSQAANHYAIGLLIIDEIQHLSRKRSGGVDKMLNFFVTLVNVIGLPVVFVGTPKARAIFERDLRSGRRGAGFGALLWEPMKNDPPKVNPATGDVVKSEWMAFTDTLWKYQWLKQKDAVLSDDMRDCWYDLSQGVLDIVVKLFVLVQLRAIVTGVERITPKLLQKVYDDELQPVHPMLSALRSGDPDSIAQYSDLTVPEIDRKVLTLRKDIILARQENEIFNELSAINPQAERLYNLLVGMDLDGKKVLPLIKDAFAEYPNLKIRELIPIILDWDHKPNKESKSKNSSRVKSVSKSKWHTLDSSDMRFMYSQADKGRMYEQLKKNNLVFDVKSWLKDVG